MRFFCAFLALVFVATLGTSSALVDAGTVTTVTVDATAYDERTSGNGCSPDGCVPENTRDGSRRSNSRWSCKDGLVDDSDCKITYYFDTPQDIVRIRISYYNGDSSQKWLKIKLNGTTHSTVQSSGETNGFQNFNLDSYKTSKLSLKALRLDSNEWISIKEVRFMV